MQRKSVLLVSLLCVILTMGCSSRKGSSNKGSSDNQKIAEEVIEIANDYLAKNITAKEALEKMENLEEKIESAQYAFGDPCSGTYLATNSLCLKTAYEADTPSDILVISYRDLLAEGCKVSKK